MSPERKPPMNLDEVGAAERPERGTLSYVGSESKGGGKKGYNITQILLGGLVGVVLSLLVVTRVVPTKAGFEALGSKINDIAGQITKIDEGFKRDAVRIDNLNDLAKTLASKNDLIPLAKKDDLGAFARKEDLGPLVRQVDLIPMARKDDLTRLAGKDELRIIEERLRSSDGLPAKITGVETLVKGIEAQVKATDEKITSADGKVKVSVEDIGRKIAALEANQLTLANKITSLESIQRTTPVIPPASGSVEAEISMFGIPGAYGYLGMTYDLTRSAPGATEGQGTIVSKTVKLKVTNKTGRDISNTNLVLNFIASGNIPDLWGTPDVVGSAYPWTLVAGGSKQTMLIFASGFGQFGAGMPLNRDETKTMYLSLRLAADNSLFPSGAQTRQVSFTPTVTVDSWDYR